MKDKHQWLIVVTAGKWQLSTIEKAKELGFSVAAIDSDPQALGLQKADMAIVSKFTDFEKIVIQLSDINVAGVLSPCSEAGMHFASLLREHFDLIGPDQCITENLLSKEKQRELWEVNQLNQLWWKVLECHTEALNFLSICNSACIVKPIDSAGSRGVCVIKPETKDKQKLIENAFSYSKSGKIIIEEFISGTEYAVDSITCDGDTSVLSIAAKNKLPHGGGVVAYELFTPEYGELNNKIAMLVNKAYQALGYKNGIGHAEVIVNPNGIYLVEVAGRGGGFSVFDGMVPGVSGVDIVKLSILQATGNEFAIGKLTQRYARLKFLPTKNGVVKSIEGIPEVNKLDGVYAEPLVEIGDSLSTANSDGDRMVYILAYSDTHLATEMLVKRAEQLINVRIN